MSKTLDGIVAVLDLLAGVYCTLRAFGADEPFLWVGAGAGFLAYARQCAERLFLQPQRDGGTGA